MKKCILPVLGAMAISSLLVSCHDDWGQIANGNGRIAPSVELDNEVIRSRSAETEAQGHQSRAGEITVTDLALRLTKNDGSGAWEYASIAEFPVDRDFAIGQYTLEAYYGDKNEQGFDLPSYYGSQTITVEDGKTTSPSLIASMSKAMVTIKYTDAFKGYMTDWSADVNGVAYDKDEDRPVYVTPGNVTVKINVTKPNGNGGEFTLDPVNAEAKHHYVISVDVNNGNVGDVMLTVTFDDTMDAEDVEIDLSDRLLSTPAPEITPKGFVSGENIEVVTGITPDQSLSMNVVALAGIKNAVLKTTSASLVGQGWPAEIDLLGADAATQAKLTELGLDVVGLWKTPGEMAVVTFSDVVKHIATVDGNDNISTFTLTVKDKLMRECDPVTLAFQVEDPTLNISSTDKYFTAGENLTLTLQYNGSSSVDVVKEAVSVQYKNPVANAWRNLEVVDVQAASRAMSNFVLTVKAPADLESALTVRAVSGKVTSNEITFDVVPFKGQVNDVNVYTSSAYANVISITSEPAPSLNDVKFAIKKAGENTFTEIAHEIINGLAYLKGLTPGTDYQLIVINDDMRSSAVAFRTEDAAQLPNSDMESWSSTRKSSGAMSCTNYTCEGWATLNDLTTSKLNSATNYSALSSTLPDNGGHSGQAALIRTVGYNMSTAAAGTNNPKDYAVGELYLGSYDGGAQYGTAFTSRPKSMSFWYKYSAYAAGDQGYAEIVILDSENRVIATKTTSLATTDAYQNITLDLSYPEAPAKAAYIKVIFRSSDSGKTDCKKSTGLLGILNDYYVGSKLYVDDIQLNY